ncbi:transposase [Robbsia andropogonis]
MTDKDSELRVLLHRRDGRRRYDEDFKRNLVKAALRPGVSVARLAQDNR